MATTHTSSPRSAAKRIDAGDLEPKAALTIAAPQIAFIIVKARAFDAEVPPGGTEDGSDMVDDRAVAALEDTADNPTREELAAALRDLNVDQMSEMLALVWIGRGDFTGDDWPQAIRQARDFSDRRTVKYLLETPLLADLIEDGLDEMGYNVTNEEMKRS